MTNFEMICKNPDYQHIIRESLISECAVGNDNHLHLCRDLQCEECQIRQKKKSGYFSCFEHTKIWLDEEFRPVFKKEGDEA